MNLVFRLVRLAFQSEYFSGTVVAAAEGWHLVGSKVKGRISISIQVFQGNKATQISRKTNISYPLIRTRMCAYQGVRNACFSENLACFVFL